MTDVVKPATAQDRLERIAEAHCKYVDTDGGTFNNCNECGWLWPCATYRWATEPEGTLGALCCWDLSDCEASVLCQGHEPEADRD